MRRTYKDLKKPEMLQSFVCYADILGYSKLSKDAIKSGRGQEFLDRLYRALTSAYDRIKKRSVGWKNYIYFEVKVFTDNIVIGYPVDDYAWNLGEPELGDILDFFSEFQAMLSIEGFLVRGGIAFGGHYMDKDIVFGEALLDAVDQDKNGGPPRISLTSPTIDSVKCQLGFYGGVIENSPHFIDLLEDADGTIFINYLGQAFSAFPDNIFFDLIEGHQKTITEGLQRYKGVSDIRAKYEWAARYHNFICKEFANECSSYNPDTADDEFIAACSEAQNLLKYLIDIESLAASPSRIKLKAIRLERKQTEK